MQRTASTIVVAMIALTMQASAFVLRYAAPTKASVSADEEAVVLTAVDMLQGDVQRVLGINLEITDHDASIIIGTMGGSNAKRIARSGINLDYLVGRKQAFVMASLVCRLGSGGQMWNRSCVRNSPCLKAFTRSSRLMSYFAASLSTTRISASFHGLCSTTSPMNWAQ